MENQENTQNVRGRAQRRHLDYAKAIRKRKITEEVYWDGKEYPYYDNLHQYSKNKIHCSCPMCQVKTKKTRKRKNNLAWGGEGKYDYKISERRTQDKMDADMSTYYEEVKDETQTTSMELATED